MTVHLFLHHSVFNLLADSAAGFPESTAIAFLGKHMSYAQLLKEVEGFSAVLAGLGVGHGDRVGLLLPNSPQYVIAWYACYDWARSRSATTCCTRSASSSTR